MARRYPMMAEFQVIIVKEAQNIRSLEALEKYLKNPVKSTILVWCHKNGKIDARKKGCWIGTDSRGCFCKVRSCATISSLILSKLT